MKKEVREQIIYLVDSKDMREHLLSVQGELDDNCLLKLIGCVPVSLERKRELLRAFINDEEAQGRPMEKTMETVNELKCALKRLHNLKKGDLLMLEARAVHTIGGLNVNLPGIANAEHSKIYSSFQAVLRDIQQIDSWYRADQMEHFDMEYGEKREQYTDEEWEAMEKEWAKPAYWYWELFLKEFCNDPDDKEEFWRTAYRFVLTPKGEAQYVSGNLNLDLLTGGATCNPLELPALWQPGDILRIDCSPFAPKNCYCLVLRGDFSICLYRTASGRVGIGNILDDYYYENINETWQYLPGLLRAERYEGELPEDCEWMIPLQEKLREIPPRGEWLIEKIDPYGSGVRPYDIISVGGEDNCRYRFDENEWQVSVEELFHLAGISK